MVDRPICVAPQLVPFLPTNPIVSTGGENAITAISSAPWGSALACLISYGYITMLGSEGLTSATENAILNANYIKERLQGHFNTLYTGEMGRAAHEMIIDCREFKEKGIEVVDIAKRLMDYGFHAPTVSFPVAGTQAMLTADAWNYPYTRKQAAFPLDYITENKFWPSVRRVNDAFGDRNLICSCTPIEDYI